MDDACSVPSAPWKRSGLHRIGDPITRPYWFAARAGVCGPVDDSHFVSRVLVAVGSHRPVLGAVDHQIAVVVDRFSWRRWPVPVRWRGCSGGTTVNSSFATPVTRCGHPGLVIQTQRALPRQARRRTSSTSSLSLHDGDQLRRTEQRTNARGGPKGAGIGPGPPNREDERHRSTESMSHPSPEGLQRLRADCPLRWCATGAPRGEGTHWVSERKLASSGWGRTHHARIDAAARGSSLTTGLLRHCSPCDGHFALAGL
jgi:hypothetical protein